MGISALLAHLPLDVWLTATPTWFRTLLGGSGDANERLIAAALEHGALGAKLAGAGDGGTIIALHPEPEEMIAALEAAGSERIFRPCVCRGVCLDEDDDEAALRTRAWLGSQAGLSLSGTARQSAEPR